MGIERLQSISKGGLVSVIRRLYGFLARRAYSAIIFGALFCTLAVKFFHSYRNALIDKYLSWTLADIAVLLGIELVLAAVCLRWPRRWVIRTATVVAAVVCTWSVMNAGWLIRTGTQILPSSLLPLFRDPLNALRMVGINLVKMPVAAMILLGPSAIAIGFFFLVLLKPQPASYSRKHFANKAFISCIIIFIAVLTRGIAFRHSSESIISQELRYNCQLRAITGLILPNPGQLTRADLSDASRSIPAFDQLKIELLQKPQRINHNVVMVVLEGIQYRYTSLADRRDNLMPHLAALAEQGAEFVNARSTVTHTTKALFSFLTGRYPSVSHDVVEAVPALKPYASIATILEEQLNFRTAFFQSAKGDFESRPGLVYNLGFDKFWARDDLNDPNAYLGYLACDEFSMIKPITEWIKASEKPFFLTILCSVTHDPYEVPTWFAKPAKEPLERYRQAIFYTDKFIAALDTEFAKLNLADKTIFCVIADHGEAFGEHGLQGHERIVFEEVLRIPWVIRAPGLIEPTTKITAPVSSVDFGPTLLALLGFDVNEVGFDGVNALGPVPADRKIFFCDWKHESCAGFVQGNHKFIYNPANEMIYLYDLAADPFELTSLEVPQQQLKQIADDIIAWRKNTIFHLEHKGEKLLFGRWFCRWKSRGNSDIKYLPQAD